MLMHAEDTERAREDEHDFSMERRLAHLDPALHRRFTDAVFALQHNLSNYKLLFPEYTDHTVLHSLTVIDFCNRLIGDQIDALSADEVYTLLMGCYFHDTGMGISRRDYELFSQNLDFGDYFETHSPENYADVIRDFHHEFSAQFIRKYAELFEIPSEEHLRAVIQVSRGHRRTNLNDEDAYPIALMLPNGNTICTPYLAALIRLADEIDVAAARNPILLYDLEALTDALQISENKKLYAVRELTVSDAGFTLHVDCREESVFDSVELVAEKMRQTLNQCRGAVNGRTPFTITQEWVKLVRE